MLGVDVPYPDTVEALAAALAEDHVIVQETRGSGDTAGALDRIGRLVEQLPFEAYVAVIDAPPDVDAGNDSSQFLATALSRRIGEPGLYVVSASGSTTGIRIVGTGWDETVFNLQAYTDRDAVASASGDNGLAPTVEVETVLETALQAPAQSEDGDYENVSLPGTVVDELAERELDLQPYERPDLDDEPAESWSAGKRWMVGVTVGAGALLVLLQSIWGWPGWRGKRTDRPSRPVVAAGRVAAPPPDLEALRADATTELTALAETLPSTPQDEHHDRAVLAREAAEPLLSSGDLLDVVGALVLARTGRRELDIARGRARTTYRVCFFDPLHATATRTAEWRFGDSELEVPVCRACQKDVAAGRTPEALNARRRGRARPYYEGDTVWARTGYGSLTTDLADLAARVSDDRRRS